MSDFTAANPPTSSQDTLGILGAPMLSEYAILAFSSAVSKSAAVTATPAFITSTSLLFLKEDEFQRKQKDKGQYIRYPAGPFNRHRLCTLY
jgi:hypothetical protein